MKKTYIYTHSEKAIEKSLKWTAPSSIDKKNRKEGAVCPLKIKGKPYEKIAGKKKFIFGGCFYKYARTHYSSQMAFENNTHFQ